jgi:2-C-methyl-D-erythritol 2,4-cyclodiphosphate synthase
VSDLRVGIGVDAHAFASGTPLVLGGLELEGDGLAGHSDGDVVAHALIDALLGAANLGDIGSLFPSGERTPKGISSL